MTKRKIMFEVGKTYQSDFGRKYKCVKRTKCYVVFEQYGLVSKRKPYFRTVSTFEEETVDWGTDKIFGEKISARSVVE